MNENATRMATVTLVSSPNNESRDDDNKPRYDENDSNDSEDEDGESIEAMEALFIQFENVLWFDNFDTEPRNLGKRKTVWLKTVTTTDKKKDSKWV